MCFFDHEATSSTFLVLESGTNLISESFFLHEIFKPGMKMIKPSLLQHLKYSVQAVDHNTIRSILNHRLSFAILVLCFKRSRQESFLNCAKDETSKQICIARIC